MDLFSLAARLRLDDDDYRKGIEDARSKGSGLTSFLSGGFAKAAKIATAALASAATGVSALVGTATNAYAQYEQLVGGVETLYKSASSEMLKNADEAYRTAGMSANEYLETATGFAASLVQSLSNTTEIMSEDEIERNKEALGRRIEHTRESVAEKLEILQEAHDAEISDFEALTDEKIALIDRQYRENLKLIDAEQYEQLRAIDEQIDALNAQTQAEREEIQRREQARQEADLRRKVETAKTAEERQKAEERLADFLAKVAQREAEAARKEQINALKASKDAIKEQTQAKKDALKEQRDAEVKAIKDGAAQQLTEIKKAHKKELAEIKKQGDRKIAVLKKQQSEAGKIQAETAELSAEVYAEAAKYADMAIRDMSDNANKMGTAMQSIQYAYQGFAKQNFTMLDNLKLGFGGTKEEMQRLLDKAGELTGKQFDISRYADIVEAIHAIQMQMGISGLSAEEAAAAVASGAMTEEEAFDALGTTAKEAGSTIQGSAGSAAAAWKNLLVAISSGKDVKKAINNLLQSVQTAAKNIIPRVQQSLEGMGEVVTGLAPIIGDALPVLFTTLLPPLLSAGGGLLMALAESTLEQLPGILTTVSEALVGFSSEIFTAVPLVTNFLSTLSGSLPDVLAAGVEIALNLVEGIIDSLPDIADAGLDIMEALTTGVLEQIPVLVDRLPELIEAFLYFLTDNLPEIIQRGSAMTKSLSDGILQAIPDLVDKLPQIVDALINFLILAGPDIIKEGIKVSLNLAKGLIMAIPEMWRILPTIADTIMDAIIPGWEDIKQGGKNIIIGIWEGIKEKFDWLRDKALGVVNTVRGWFGLEKIGQLGTTIDDDGYSSSSGKFGKNSSKIPFGQSRLAAASEAAINAAQGVNERGESTVNLMLPDGTKLASYVFDPLKVYAEANGTPIINPS